MSQLVVIEGPDMGRTYDLGEVETLGRDPACSIRLSDRRVNAEHLRIDRRGRRWRIRSLGAGSPITINGHPVTERDLVHGDMVTVADTILLFNDEPLRPARDRLLHDVTLDPAAPPRIQARRKVAGEASTVIEDIDILLRGQDPRLETIYRVNSAIGASLDLDELLDRILKIILEVLPVDRGFILLVDEHQNRLQPRAALEKRGPARSGGAVKPQISTTVLKEVFRTHEAILATNAMEDERFLAGASVAEMRMQGVICVPLIYKGEGEEGGAKILGVIHVDASAAPRALNQDDVDLLSAIALQAAIVIAHAKMLHDRQEFAKKLVALSEATRKVSSYLQRDQILREVTRHVCNILRCKKSSIVLLEPQSQRVSLSYAVGMERPDARMPEMEAGRGLSELVLKENRPLRVSNVQELRFPTAFAKREKYDTDAFMIIPISAKSEGAAEDAPLGVINVADKINGDVFTPEDQELMVILATQAATALQNAQLYEQATVDALTGVFMRHSFFSRLERDLARAQQEGKRLSLMMLDLDHFKRVNDEHGHPVGDMVLRELGVILKQNVREGLVGRYGGEEFGVVLYPIGYEDALGVAERIRDAVRAHVFAAPQAALHITLSIGLAELRRGDDSAAAIARADQALYRAKAEGRDRIVGG